MNFGAERLDGLLDLLAEAVVRRLDEPVSEMPPKSWTAGPAFDRPKRHAAGVSEVSEMPSAED